MLLNTINRNSINKTTPTYIMLSAISSNKYFNITKIIGIKIEATTTIRIICKILFINYLL